MDEALPNEVDEFILGAELGTENEFRKIIRKPDREINRLWQRVQVPPVCPAKACPAYDDCYYYKALLLLLPLLLLPYYLFYSFNYPSHNCYIFTI